ncbi:hypothetical protein [Methylobacterium oxalidis]|uniref:hypothetical protein n=1 Tax=Methylobacterium oxalidis TaxID=944322 RepID=UPI0014787AD1|nr:hypothetical protein [Methylobacterium oxalidis]
MTNPPLAGAATRSGSVPLLVRHSLNRSDDVLQFGDPAQHAVRREHVAFGRFQDELALVRLQAVEEGFELLHEGAFSCGARLHKCGTFDFSNAMSGLTDP